MTVVAICRKNYGKIHVKANIGVSRMKSRTLANFQQCVRTIKSCFIVHFFLFNVHETCTANEKNVFAAALKLRYDVDECYDLVFPLDLEKLSHAV